MPAETFSSEEQACSSDSRIYVHKKFKKPTAVDEPAERTYLPAELSDSGISDDINYVTHCKSLHNTGQVSSFLEGRFLSVTCPYCFFVNGIPAANIVLKTGETFFCSHCASPFIINFSDFENKDSSTSNNKTQYESLHSSNYSDISEPEEENYGLKKLYPVSDTSNIKMIEDIYKQHTNNVSSAAQNLFVNSNLDQQYSGIVHRNDFVDRISLQNNEQIQQTVQPAVPLNKTVQPFENVSVLSCERSHPIFHQDSWHAMEVVKDTPSMAIEVLKNASVPSHFYMPLSNESTNIIKDVNDNICDTRKYKHNGVRMSEAEQLTSAYLPAVNTYDNMEYCQQLTLAAKEQNLTNRLLYPIPNTDSSAAGEILTYNAAVSSSNVYSDNIRQRRKVSRDTEPNSKIAMKFLQCPTCYAMFKSARMLRRHRCILEKQSYANNIHNVTRKDSIYGNTMSLNNTTGKYLITDNSGNKNIVDKFSSRNPIASCQDINDNYIQNKNDVHKCDIESNFNDLISFQSTFPLRKAKSTSSLFHNLKPNWNNNVRPRSHSTHLHMFNEARSDNNRGNFETTDQARPGTNGPYFEIVSQAEHSNHTADFEMINHIIPNSNRAQFESENQTRPNRLAFNFDMSSLSKSVSSVAQLEMTNQTRSNNNNCYYSMTGQTKSNFEKTNQIPTTIYTSSRYQNNNLSSLTSDTQVLESSGNVTPYESNENLQMLNNGSYKKDYMINSESNVTPHTKNTKGTESCKSQQTFFIMPAYKACQKDLLLLKLNPGYNNLNNVQTAGKPSKLTNKHSELSFKQNSIHETHLGTVGTPAIVSCVPNVNSCVPNNSVNENVCSILPLQLQSITQNEINNATTFTSQNSQQSANSEFADSPIQFNQSVAAFTNKDHPISSRLVHTSAASSLTKQPVNLYPRYQNDLAAVSCVGSFGVTNTSTYSVNNILSPYNFFDSKGVELQQVTRKGATQKTSKKTKRIKTESVTKDVTNSSKSARIYINNKCFFSNTKQSKSRQNGAVKSLLDQMADGNKALDINVDDGKIKAQGNEKYDINDNYIDMAESQIMTPTCSTFVDSIPSAGVLDMENHLMQHVSQKSRYVNIPRTTIISYFNSTYKCTYVFAAKFNTAVTYCTPGQLQSANVAITSGIPKILDTMYKPKNAGELYSTDYSWDLSLYDSCHRQSPFYTMAKSDIYVCLVSKCAGSLFCTGVKRSKKPDLSEIYSSFNNSSGSNSACRDSNKDNARIFATKENDAAYSLLSLHESFTSPVLVSVDHTSSVTNVMTGVSNNSDVVKLSLNSDTCQTDHVIGHAKKRKKKMKKTSVSKKGKVVSEPGNSLVSHLNSDCNETTNSSSIPIDQTKSSRNIDFTHEQYSRKSVISTSHNNRCIQQSLKFSMNMHIDKNATVPGKNSEANNCEKSSGIMCLLNDVISQVSKKNSSQADIPNRMASNNSEIGNDNHAGKLNVTSGNDENEDVVVVWDNTTGSSNSDSGPILCPNVTVGENLHSSNFGAIKKLKVKVSGKSYVLTTCDDDLASAIASNSLPAPNTELLRKPKEAVLNNLSDGVPKFTKSKTLRCKICEKKYSKASALYLHEQVHNLKDQFECKTCSVSFSKKCMLEKHNQTAGHCYKLDGIKPLVCDDCNIRFHNKGHFNKHLRSKKHIFKLECNGKLTCGTYMAMENKGFIPQNIDTTNCRTALASLTRLSLEYIAEGLITPAIVDLTVDEILPEKSSSGNIQVS